MGEKRKQLSSSSPLRGWGQTAWPATPSFPLLIALEHWWGAPLLQQPYLGTEDGGTQLPSPPQLTKINRVDLHIHIQDKVHLEGLALTVQSGY